MKVVGRDESGYVFITFDKSSEELEHQGDQAVFIPENIFTIIKTFVYLLKIEKDENYWEDNRHDQIVNLLVLFTGYEARHISNSLTALSL